MPFQPLYDQYNLEEKGKTGQIVYLHPENELFVESKARFLAAPDEVKRNIRLQIQSREVQSGWMVAAMTLFFLPFTLVALVFALLSGASVLEILGDWSSYDLVLFLIMLFMFAWTGAAFVGMAMFVGKILIDYLFYIRPMNIDAIYESFKRDSLATATVMTLTPLVDSPHTHIAYHYATKTSRGGLRLHTGNYLAEQPLDLSQGDRIYMVEAKGAKIIL